MVHHGEFNVDQTAYANMCEKMDALAVVSHACEEMLQRAAGTADKMVCIPNMLDAEAIRQKAVSSPYADGMLHIVSVGHLVPENILRMLFLRQRRCGNLALILCGILSGRGRNAQNWKY